MMMANGGKSKVATLVRVVATGGLVSLVVPWLLGKAMQRCSVVEPSRRLYEYCIEHRSPGLSRRLDPVTTIGGYSVIGSFSLLVGGTLAYDRRRWAPLPLLIGGAMGEVFLQKALKRLVKGTKPTAESSIGPPGDYPSGGAARTVITFGLLGHFFGQQWNTPAERGVIWSVVATLVLLQGASRVYLGRHWPEDVLGGWLLGLLVLRTLTEAERALLIDESS